MLAPEKSRSTRWTRSSYKPNNRSANPDTSQPGISAAAQKSLATWNIYTCEVCNLSCTGIRPYQQHIVSAKHLRNCSLQSYPTNLARDPQMISAVNNVSVPTEPVSDLFQHPDDTVFQQTGWASTNHVTPFSAGVNNLSSNVLQEYACNVCHLVCSSSSQLKEHMRGKKHYKNRTHAGESILNQSEYNPDDGIEDEEVCSQKSDPGSQHPGNGTTQSCTRGSAFLHIGSLADQLMLMEFSLANASKLIATKSSLQKQSNTNRSEWSQRRPVCPAQPIQTGNKCSDKPTLPSHLCYHTDCVIIRALAHYKSSLTEQLLQAQASGVPTKRQSALISPTLDCPF